MFAVQISALRTRSLCVVKGVNASVVRSDNTYTAAPTGAVRSHPSFGALHL
jgi:hypothetical protein